MRSIYDQTIRPEGVDQKDFARILKWTSEQAEIKRFESVMQSLMECLKRQRDLDGVPTDDGDYLGERINKVGQYIWDNWD